MTTETEQAFTELLEEVGTTHRRLVEQLSAEDDLDSLLEAHKWVLSILQVAADVNIWADTARPRFIEIVGPYKKWGGDNADAFYFFAPVDPERTYRIVFQPGDAVYMSLTVYGGPNDGRYSTRIVGSVNSHDAPRRADGSIESCSPRWSRPTREWPGSASNPTPSPPSPATISRIRSSGRRASWRIEAEDPPETFRQDDADLARRIRAATTWVREQAEHRAHPPGHAQRHRSPVPGADHDVRLGGRRRRLCHGRL